jgi:mono/diheme cytochrome c family protein
MKNSFRAFAALLVVTAAGGSAAMAASAQHGKELAQRWCATCHLVAPDQARASTDVPPFASVARQPGFDAARLALFLLDPHPKMPNMSLTRDEASDLAAYIASLK